MVFLVLMDGLELQDFLVTLRLLRLTQYVVLFQTGIRVHSYTFNTVSVHSPYRGRQQLGRWFRSMRYTHFSQPNFGTIPGCWKKRLQMIFGAMEKAQIYSVTGRWLPRLSKRSARPIWSSWTDWLARRARDHRQIRKSRWRRNAWTSRWQSVDPSEEACANRLKKFSLIPLFRNFICSQLWIFLSWKMRRFSSHFIMHTATKNRLARLLNRLLWVNLYRILLCFRLVGEVLVLALHVIMVPYG